MRRLAELTRRVARRHGAILVEMRGHPASADPGVYARDRLHLNARGHAIVGSEADPRARAPRSRRGPRHDATCGSRSPRTRSSPTSAGRARRPAAGQRSSPAGEVAGDRRRARGRRRRSSAAARGRSGRAGPSSRARCCRAAGSSRRRWASPSTRPVRSGSRARWLHSVTATVKPAMPIGSSRSDHRVSRHEAGSVMIVRVRSHAPPVSRRSRDGDRQPEQPARRACARARRARGRRAASRRARGCRAA